MEDEDYGANLIFSNFSILAEGILAVWEGEDSIRRRIEVLAERQQAMKENITGAEDVQREIRERLGALEQQSQEEHSSLQRLKQERLSALALGMKACRLDAARVHRPPFLSRSSQLLEHHHFHRNNNMPYPHSGSVAPKEVQHCATSAVTVLSARQTAAFEMLDFAHERLTSHMWAHMCERVRSMQTEEQRGEYLRIFRGVDGRSAFGTKPLSEATYAELLDFALKKREEIEVEVEVTLEAAERRLVEEACKAGYGNGHGSIGNMRMQMLVYLQFHRHFKSATTQQRIALGFLSTCTRQPNIILHTQSAARLGQLGALQPASQLIQLACFFLSRA